MMTDKETITALESRIEDLESELYELRCLAGFKNYREVDLYEKMGG